MKKFEILITTPPDRDNIVVEIWQEDILIAEVNKESEYLQIEFYLNKREIFNLDEFLNILEIAKREIIG